MNFISAEEFLKQSDKAQEVFINWWKPQLGDLATGKINSISAIQSLNDVDTVTRYKGNPITPLLQIHQLIDFIEEKNYKLEINNFKKNLKDVAIYKNLFQTTPTFNILETDLLEALWQVACKIAGE